MASAYLIHFHNLPTMSVPMSHMGFYLLYSPYTFILPRMTIFTMDLSVYVTPCTPITLVEIYRHVLPCTPVLSVETSVHAITISSVHVMSVHALTRSSVHVLLRASLIVLPYVYVSVHGLPRHPRKSPREHL